MNIQFNNWQLINLNSLSILLSNSVNNSLSSIEAELATFDPYVSPNVYTNTYIQGYYAPTKLVYEVVGNHLTDTYPIVSIYNINLYLGYEPFLPSIGYIKLYGNVIYNSNTDTFNGYYSNFSYHINSPSSGSVSDFQFAGVFYIDSFGDLTSGIATSFSVRVDNNYASLTGNLTLNSAGDITGGTVTGFSFVDSAGQKFEVSGVSINYSVFDNLTDPLSGHTNLTDLYNLVFSPSNFNGNDTIVADNNDNNINGFAGSDNISGGGGNDTLDGGTSNVYNPGVIDVLNGGDGNDTFLSRGFFGAGIYNGGIGTDLLDFSQADAYTAGRRTAEGAGVNVNLELNKASVYYNKLANIHFGANSTWADANGQIAVSGIENVRGTAQADILIGDANANVLEGGAGDDTLSGGGGLDTLIGGLGNDIYVYDGVDIITELANEGSDTLQVNITSSLGSLANIENLTLIGIAAINGTGDANNNVLTGNSASNTLNGGLGNDTLDGGASDVYNPGVIDTLNGDAGNDTFLSRGFYGAGSYFGGADIDTLDFSQADAYTAGRRATEKAGVKVDLNLANASVYYVRTSNFTWADANGQIALNSIENVRGTSQSDLVTGDANANVLDGGTSNVYNPGVIDVLNGGDGNDTFLSRGFFGAGIYNGGIGTDLLDFSQADAYTAGRRTAEGAGVNVNLELNKASVYYNKLANIHFGANSTWADANGQIAVSGIENVRGTAQADILIGDANANVLEGGAGDDTLSGGGGLDTLIGGLGNDIYTIDILTDVVTENLNEGADLVNVAASAAGGTYTLAANIENSTLVNTAAYNLTGNALNNVLTGNAAANVLDGATGNDTLVGGLGADTFVFSTIDTSNFDVITDFISGQDKINLSGAAFSPALTAGIFTDMFVTGANALDANDYIIYNKTTGELFFDADANGAGSKELIAKLYPNTNLLQSDFINALTTTQPIANLTLNGTPQADTLSGGAGDDTISGGLGNDILNGMEGNDTVYGNEGNDVIISIEGITPTDPFTYLNVGLDRLDGGEGSDIYSIINGGGSFDYINDTGVIGVDEIRYSITPGGASAITLDGSTSGIERVVLGTGTGASADTSGTEQLSIFAYNVIYGLTLVGNNGNNQINGTNFNDTINGGGGSDTIYGLDGNDTIIAAMTSIIYGGNGNDIITIDASSGALNGSTIIGEAGNDTITGSAASSDALYGGDGDDVIYGKGGAAPDSLFGNNGNDTIISGDGSDFMYGGSGADIFTFESLNGVNGIIFDFSSAELDRIDLSFLDANSNTPANDAFTFVTAFTSATGQLMYDSVTQNVAMDTNGDGIADFTIGLSGVATMQASDFIL